MHPSSSQNNPNAPNSSNTDGIKLQVTKKPRRSENINQNILHNLQQIPTRPQYTETHLQPSSNDPNHQSHSQNQQSSFLSSNQQQFENYTTEEISKAFKFLSESSKNDQNHLDATSLVNFLQEQGESAYTAVEMIALLDKDQKGHVSEEEFRNFFQKGQKYEEEDITIPQDMERDRRLVEFIDKYYDSYMEEFQDGDFCDYAAKEIKKFKYSEQL